jgi:hypothetical protein
MRGGNALEDAFMSKTEAKCVACGALLTLEAAGVFVTADVVGALCSVCADRQVTDRGGCILTLRHTLPAARFPLGKITVTPGAIEALSQSGQHATSFLSRHAAGDWGTIGECDRIELTEDERRRGWEATDDSGKINKSNLLRGQDRIMSEYLTQRGQRVWVITDLGRQTETTVLVPEEY